MSDQAAPPIRSEADTLIPKVLVRAMLALVLSALAITVFATLTNRPLEATPPVSEVVRERVLILGGGDDLSGAVKVLDGHGSLVADLSPEQGGFIAGVHRVILRERIKARLPADGPVLLRAHKNGRMAIHDPSTGWSADLMGFGADNAKAFARLLD